MPTDRAQMTLRFLAAPSDAGQSGLVSARRVDEWIDKTGYAAAARWSGSYAVSSPSARIKR